MSEDKKRRIAVACQGGGSHAAFAAGALMEILEPGRFAGVELVGLSGTSGGAVCASLAWSGLVREGGGPSVASEVLRGFWADLSAQDPLDAAVNFWSVSLARLPVSWEISPYTVYAPAEPRLRSLLGQHLIFPKPGAPRQPPEIFIGATDVLKGGGLAFDASVLGIDHIIASAAVPPLFRAVRVAPDHLCWDGLFSRNPPIREFTNLQSGPPDEIWIIRINPTAITHEPTLSSEIIDRRNELAGNLSLDQEIFFIEKINELRKEIEPLGKRYKHIEIRQIELALDLDYPSKLDRGVRHIQRLIETGRDAAGHFFKAAPEPKLKVRTLSEPVRETA